MVLRAIAVLFYRARPRAAVVCVVAAGVQAIVQALLNLLTARSDIRGPDQARCRKGAVAMSLPLKQGNVRLPSCREQRAVVKVRCVEVGSHGRSWRVAKLDGQKPVAICQVRVCVRRRVLFGSKVIQLVTRPAKGEALLALRAGAESHQPSVRRLCFLRSNVVAYAAFCIACRPDDLREIAERFGEVRDVYIPRNHYTQQPRGFAFIEFQDARACEDASYDMQGIEIEGRPVRPLALNQCNKQVSSHGSSAFTCKTTELWHKRRHTGLATTMSSSLSVLFCLKVEVNIAKDKRKQPEDFRPKRRYDDRDGGGGGRRYDDRGGGGSDRRSGYDDRRRDHDDRRDDRGRYDDRRGGYSDRRGGYEDRRGGGYDDRRNDDRRSGYDERRDERPPRRARDDSPPLEAGERSRSRSRSRGASPAKRSPGYDRGDRSRSPASRESSMDPPPARGDAPAGGDDYRSRERDSFD